MEQNVITKQPISGPDLFTSAIRERRELSSAASGTATATPRRRPQLTVPVRVPLSHSPFTPPSPRCPPLVPQSFTTATTMSFTIFSYPANPRVLPVLIAAELAGVAVDVPPFTMGTNNKTPEFLALNPTGRVPAMRTPGGLPVWESPALTRAIARAAPAAGLAGATPLDAAAIDAWMSVVASDLVPAVGAMVSPHLYPSLKYEAGAAAKARAGMDKVLVALERVLVSQTYLVGERVTLADVWAVVVLSILMEHILDGPARASMPNVMRYFTTLASQPAFAKALGGDVKLCETPLGPVKKSK